MSLFTYNFIVPFVASAIGFLANIFTFVMFLKLAPLYFSFKHSKQTIPCMSIYVAIELGYSITSACYFAYFCTDLVIGSGETFHAYYLYGFGLPTVIFMALILVALAFLSFDRCLSIIFPKILRIHRVLGYCSIAALLFSIAFIVVISPAPKSSSTICYTLSCLITANGKFVYTVYRMSYGAIVVIFSIVLAIMVQRKLKLSDTAVRINKIVLKTVIILLMFDFVPYLVSLTLRNVFQSNWTPTFAPYIVLSALDNFFVAWLYSRNIKHLNSAKTAPLPQTHQHLSSSTKKLANTTTS